MESLGHYLLRDRIALPGTGSVELFEGQDVRTGISTLIFRGCDGPYPVLSLAGALPWIDKEDNAWIAEIPVGAVQSSWLAGRVEMTRLLLWTKQLIETLHQAQQADIPVGYILPEVIWARGRKVWLGGIGVESEAQRWDFGGLLHSLKVIAGELYPAMPWREALEGFVSGEVDYEHILQALNDAETHLEPLPVSSTQIQTIPTPSLVPETTPSQSKPLNVEVGELAIVKPTPSAPPRRIQLDSGTEPPFEVLSPNGASSRRSAVFWLLLIPLILLAVGGYLFVRSRPKNVVASPNVFPVEFRTQPIGSAAEIVLLETPVGSTMALNSPIAKVPGTINFDKEGTYRIQVRVQGRSPKESLIVVPNPNGVNISLR